MAETPETPDENQQPSEPAAQTPADDAAAETPAAEPAGDAGEETGAAAGTPAARRRTASGGTKKRSTTGSAGGRGTTGRSSSGRATSRPSTERGAGSGRSTSSSRKPPKTTPPRRTEKSSTLEDAAERTAEAGRSVSEQVFRRVEEMIDSGRTAKAAFEVVARERKMSVSNVQQQYYRFRRKARDTAREKARDADERLRSSTREIVPRRDVDAVRTDLRVIGDDMRVLSVDVARAIGDVLVEANRSEAAQRLRSNLRSIILPRR